MGGTLHVTGTITGDAKIDVQSVSAQIGNFTQSCTAPNIK
jgi:hypothetical protein